MDWENQRVTCPQGKVATDWWQNQNGGVPSIRVQFDFQDCFGYEIYNSSTSHSSHASASSCKIKYTEVKEAVMATSLPQATLSSTKVFFHTLSADQPSRVKRKTFEAITGLDYYALDTIWLKQGEVPEHLSARAMMTNLGALLDLRSKEVASLLGVSESRISRNDRVTLAMLDRAEGISDTFARVAAVLGFEHARDWFKAPNAALEGSSPYTLLSTHYGQKKVDNLVTALLNGAVV